MMRRVTDVHVGTLFPDTHRARKGESGTHEEEAQAARAQKTEVKRRRKWKDT